MRQGNLFWGNHLNYFCIKPRSMDAQVLFRSFHTKIIQSTTAITSIVASLRLQIILIVIRIANRLRIKRGFLIFRHCEAIQRIAEAIHKKNKIDCHDFATQNLAMTSGDSSLRGQITDSHEAIHITKIKEHK